MKKSIFNFTNVYLNDASSTVGKKEFEGPLGDCFDLHENDEYFGCDNFEAAESEMARRNLNILLNKQQLSPKEVDIYFGGDLINQCVPTSYCLNGIDSPFIGLYGACSTIVEAIICASVFIESKLVSNAIAISSSHFCASERQYRFPLEYGSIRTPTSQNTVTGAGAYLLSCEPSRIKVKSAIVGKVIDKEVKDANNMGAAMAGAAVDTIMRFFEESNVSTDQFDVIVTGDLGHEGHDIAMEMLKLEGFKANCQIADCGMMIYDKEKQDTHSGGSGCGCISSVMAGYFVRKLQNNEMKNVLMVGTGALLNPNSVFQKHSIPGIAHAIHLQAED